MKKDAKQPDVWNEDTALDAEVTVDLALETLPEPESVNDLKPQAATTRQMEYSIAGLKEDFPTAKELEQFVFDETRVALKLKGIDPAKKYEIAYAVLTGADIDSKYITGVNPYLDNNELIPEDPLQDIPRRDPKLPNETYMSVYLDMNVPHPDKEMRSLGAKVHCRFMTYPSGAISYEITGPLEKHSQGEKLDKYGRSRPEKFVWVDPRTGEQAIRYSDGTYTKMGQRLRTLMEARRVNKQQTVWSIWIDRSFTQFNRGAIDNPWAD
ncbi:hypothetical protein UFOVP180_3 [uncultured Caudovirales phage]|uniref:Uncharacterized protein n=1 Tax=uncultured Caudovirales phage TaxID=2100421 RepID=A0A6J7WHJ1_9CAUD|nr:hypothetical protein UFOVP180_3 [uncultured Caudovirales phage]